MIANERSVKQVLINLISNAIKYNKPGGRVMLSAAAVPGHVEVAVEDTGIGIPEELHERIFRPFDRLAASDGRVGGTGIGLHISRRLLEDMGATLEFSSEEGVGSRFHFRLPIFDAEP